MEAHYNTAQGHPASTLAQGGQAAPDPELEELKSLQQVIASTSVQLLEKGIEAGIYALEEIRRPFEAKEEALLPESAEWLKAIDALRRPSTTKTILGVVGSTGAGKSSVISAVLDEERLLPTNCMRACTASVTEISYNDSEDPTELYRGEIEFISADDWMAELHHLRTDLLDGNGEVGRDCTKAEADAGIAYAKIKAVYPRKTKEMIAKTTPEDFVKEPAVRKILGSTKTLKAMDAESLYTQLQTFVDSKEKSNEKAMEYWPLIKVVKIYVKAAALATGACIVDLPGVQDSNAARAAVADSYMKNCNALWIVAPINRAVDDKTAKNLLGDSFRRQLKMDGTYTSVTFICSKTDDLSVTEAVESLGYRAMTQSSFDSVAHLEKSIKDYKAHIVNLRERKDALEQQSDELDVEWDKWEALTPKVLRGETVYAPVKDEQAKKRKRQGKPLKSRKVRKSEVPLSDDSDEGETSDKENSHPWPSLEGREPLTSDDIDAELKSLKSKRRELRQEIRTINDEIEASRAKSKQAGKEIAESQAQIREMCIKGRNAYSQNAIREDFASGIRELDQEDDEAQDPDNFDPEVDKRDYDAIAAALPVFCVSSRAFQNMCGRLPLDKFDPTGFRTIEDTGIPSLQEHARALTEEVRASAARRWMHEFGKLICSLIIWAGNDGKQTSMTDSEKEQERERLETHIRWVTKHINTSVKQCIANMRRGITEHIYQNFDRLLPDARAMAPDICEGWGGNTKEKGMVWSTYKATIKRHGVWAGASGSRNLNEELFDPVAKYLVIGWDKAFQNRLPAALETFSQAIQEGLVHFHRNATSGRLQPTIRTLDSQLKNRLNSIRAYPQVLQKMIQELQKTANRSFTPEIQNRMKPGYEAALLETGPGSFKRMKERMLTHVTGHCDDIFKGTTDTVQEMLEEMQARVSGQITAELQDVLGTMGRDYYAVLVGHNAASFNGLPRQERLLRAEVLTIVQQADRYFEVVTREPPVGGDDAHVGGDDVGEWDELLLRIEAVRRGVYGIQAAS